jgi:hypothetical protein
LKKKISINRSTLVAFFMVTQAIFRKKGLLIGAKVC